MTNKIMIHACPARMWYVEEFMIPELTKQGAEKFTVWNDLKRQGNLKACMAAFESCTGDGGTWHVQDDVLFCRDFTQRISAIDEDRVVCGFVNEISGPDCNIAGAVYMPDMWYSFPCLYIPNQLARECAAWYRSGEWQNEAQPISVALFEAGSGDDLFFKEFMELHHGGETAVNLKPCLVEHVDWLIGGSQVSPYRGYYSRAVFWRDEDLVRDLDQRIKARNRRS